MGTSPFAWQIMAYRARPKAFSWIACSNTGLKVKASWKVQSS